MTSPRRRGVYAILFVVVLVGLLGITAYTLNVAWLTTCRAEATAVAESAARSGARILRRSGDTATAASAVQAVVAANTVCGRASDPAVVEFGRWDETQATPAFVPSATPADALRVSIGRTGSNAISPLWDTPGGPADASLTHTEVGAVRGAQLAFILDILPANSGHWTESEVLLARDGAVAALQRLADVSSDTDGVAMVLSAGPRAWTWTSLTDLATPGAPATLQASWNTLRLMSDAGTQGFGGTDADGADCNAYAFDLFFLPPGGCYPNMPRRYVFFQPALRATWGLDLSVALDVARAQLTGAPTPAEVRGIVILTAGDPRAVQAVEGQNSPFWNETRYPETVGTFPRPQADVEAAILASAQAAWTTEGTHVWVVSLDTASAFYPTVTQGLGTYQDVVDPADLDDTLLEIVASLPVGVVR